MVKKNSDLTAEQKLILFEEETEHPGSSELNNEKREGSYHCVNCDEKLFDSSTKYESGSGWPSFYQSLPDVFETKTDYLLGYGRTEWPFDNKSYFISSGDKIAQILIQEVPNFRIEEVNDLDSTDRGEGGFGSSGK